MNLKFCTFLVMTFFCIGARCQKVAVKTNLLYDATATINAGVEFGLSPQWTFEMSGNYNNWTMSHDHKWKHWLIQPEARYWFCNRFIGHFVGFHAHGGKYNVGNLDNGISFWGTDLSKLSDSRYQGWFVGAGVAYGYSWVLSRHWNLEFELGIGYAYSRFDRYPCATCGERLDEGDHHYFGPTKAAVNLIYAF